MLFGGIWVVRRKNRALERGFLRNIFTNSVVSCLSPAGAFRQVKC